MLKKLCWQFALYFKAENCKANAYRKLPKTECYQSLKLSLQGMGGSSIFGDMKTQIG